MGSGLTSSAVPVSSRTSSSPSSLAPWITSSGAPRNSGQGVSNTVASASDRSLHPRSTRTARISHSLARDTLSVAIEIWFESVTNCTLFRRRQKTGRLAGVRVGAGSSQNDARPTTCFGVGWGALTDTGVAEREVLVT
jgi:hypothetical protein